VTWSDKAFHTSELRGLIGHGQRLPSRMSEDTNNRGAGSDSSRLFLLCTEKLIS
jgi:hypothetical protein